MANSKMEFWLGLPSWAKGLTVVGGLSLVGWAVIRVYSDVKAKKNNQQANQDAASAVTDIAILHQNGVDPTYVQNDFIGFAQTINQAISGCGNDTNTVMGVFGKMKNTADLLNLISAYGVKELDPCVLNPFDIQTGTWNWIGSKVGLTSKYSGSLPQALKMAYLSTPETITQINTILSNSNINYQF